ncbi:MAG: hypothetical protein HUJ75_00475 [Parasporobacterium sp.]|nr:hypothetical protein [Parasporobacterium sp.]
MLDGLVDIYLPDFKYYDDALAKRYSNAPGYFHIASRAIDEMFRQVGEPQFGEDEIMQKGIIIRHLILPGCSEDSRKIIRYLYEKYGDAVYLSIMNQYTPVGDLSDFPELTRKVTDEEYDNVVDYAIELGVENAFIQEGDTAEESFIPDFNEWNPEEFLGNDV